MGESVLRFCFILILILLTVSSSASMTLASNETEGTESESWEFEFTPYIWAAGLDGDVSTGGVTSPIENDYNFLVLENLDLAGSATFEARKQNWALLFDGLYTRFSDDLTNPSFRTNLVNEGGFFEAAVSYRFEKLKFLEIIAGARYVFVNLDLALTPGPVVKGSKDWVDPVLGLRFSWEMTDRWLMRLRGDLGGFGAGSDLVSSAALTIEYRLSEIFSLKAGYRFMKGEFEDQDFVHDVSLSGFGLGLGIRF
jgi:hypothetical protein